MINEIGAIYSKTNERMLRMWQVSVERGKRTVWQHSHICFEIAVIINGNAIYHTESKDYNIEKGNVFVFSSNEIHCISDVISEKLEIINMQFEPRYLFGNSFDSFTNEHINFCFNHNKNFENRITGDNSAYIKSIILNIADELKEQKSEYGLLVKSFLNNILVYLIRYCNYSDNSVSVSREQLHSIRNVLSYIDENISEEITLNNIARIAGMSPTYFSSLFRDISGVTLWDYIVSKRIEKSIRILESDVKQHSMLEIAELCGFNNTANFNKAFKKRTGMTPSKYRKDNDSLII